MIKFSRQKMTSKPKNRFSFAAEMIDFFQKNRPFLLVSLAFFAFCGGLAAGWRHGDEILFFNQWRGEPLNSVFRFWTKLGEHIAFYALILAAALVISFRKSLVVFVTGCAVIALAYSAKTIFHEPRPAYFFESEGRLDEVVFVPEIYVNRGPTSFPSGHSMGAFALWGLLAFWSKRKNRAAFLAILPIGVAVSRVFLVQHFLVDIIFGGLLGLLLAYFFWKMSESPRLFRAAFWQRSVFFRTQNIV